MTKVDTLLYKVSASSLRHVLFLPDLLALDTVLDIKSPKVGDTYSFISERAMEQLCSFLENKTSPQL